MTDRGSAGACQAGRALHEAQPGEERCRLRCARICGEAMTDPAALRAAVIEALGEAIVKALTTRSGFRHIIDNLDEDLFAELKAHVGDDALIAAERHLAEAGCKIVGRQPTLAQRCINGSANWTQMFDAAPPTPWTALLAAGPLAALLVLLVAMAAAWR